MRTLFLIFFCLSGIAYGQTVSSEDAQEIITKAQNAITLDQNDIERQQAIIDKHVNSSDQQDQAVFANVPAIQAIQAQQAALDAQKVNSQPVIAQPVNTQGANWPDKSLGN